MLCLLLHIVCKNGQNKLINRRCYLDQIFCDNVKIMFFHFFFIYLSKYLINQKVVETFEVD